MTAVLTRILRWLGFGRGAPPDFDDPRDPYSRKPAPVRSDPKNRSGTVAVAEPDE